MATPCAGRPSSTVDGAERRSRKTRTARTTRRGTADGDRASSASAGGLFFRANRRRREGEVTVYGRPHGGSTACVPGAMELPRYYDQIGDAERRLSVFCASPAAYQAKASASGVSRELLSSRSDTARPRPQSHRCPRPCRAAPHRAAGRTVTEASPTRSEMSSRLFSPASTARVRS